MHPASDLQSAANNVGEIPQKWGSSTSLVLTGFSGEGTLWASFLLVALTHRDAPVLCTPLLPRLVAQTLHHLCRATLVTPDCVAFFALRFRNLARESRYTP